MTFWNVFSIIALVLFGFGAMFWLVMRIHQARFAAMSREINELRSDNRVLMEAVAQKSGSPLIFQPPKMEPGEGWFDSVEVKPSEDQKPIRQY
jgi:hypothetical protein